MDMPLAQFPAAGAGVPLKTPVAFQNLPPSSPT